MTNARLFAFTLLAPLALSFAACLDENHPIHCASDDGLVKLAIDLDGTIRNGDDLIARYDLAAGSLEMLSGPSAGKKLRYTDDADIVKWRGPVFTVRDRGMVFSIDNDDIVKVDHARWGRCQGYEQTVGQKSRFVAGMTAYSRL